MTQTEKQKADESRYYGFWTFAGCEDESGCWEYRGGAVVMRHDEDCGAAISAISAICTPDGLKGGIDRGEFVPSQWLPAHARPATK